MTTPSTRTLARRYRLHHSQISAYALTHHVTPLRAARLLALQRARRPRLTIDALEALADAVMADMAGNDEIAKFELTLRRRPVLTQPLFLEHSMTYTPPALHVPGLPAHPHALLTWELTPILQTLAAAGIRHVGLTVTEALQLLHQRGISSELPRFQEAQA